jgi:Bacteriocin-protection, YdeI or OmpD-Associated/Domain of unknown function (DUF1905)
MPRFTATLEARGAGRLVEVPLDVRALFGQARAPVKATVNGHAFRSTIAVYGGKYYLGFNRDVRAAAGVEVGDVVTIDLERDADKRTVEVPRDLEAALDPATRATFDDLSFTHRREYVRWIEEAKREDTRRRRVAKAIEMLRTGVKTPG